jgi:hypothetical protein
LHGCRFCNQGNRLDAIEAGPHRGTDRCV